MFDLKKVVYIQRISCHQTGGFETSYTNVDDIPN